MYNSNKPIKVHPPKKVNNIPFCAIRAISDNTKAMEYKEFLNIATKNLYNVVINYIKNS